MFLSSVLEAADEFRNFPVNFLLQIKETSFVRFVALLKYKFFFQFSFNFDNFLYKFLQAYTKKNMIIF